MADALDGWRPVGTGKKGIVCTLLMQETAASRVYAGIRIRGWMLCQRQDVSCMRSFFMGIHAFEDGRYVARS